MSRKPRQDTPKTAQHEPLLGRRVFTIALVLDVREAEKQMVVRWPQSTWWGQPGGNPAKPHQEGDGYQTPEARPRQPMIAPLSSRTTRSGDTKSVRPTLTA